MQTPQQAARMLEELTALLRGRNQQILEVWPHTRYMACLDKYPETAWLGYRSPEVQKACEEISGTASDSGLELYHRTLLLALICRATGILPQQNLPDEIKLLYEENFSRIMLHIESTIDQPTHYLYPLSPFCKDLALCTLRLIPAGVEKVHASRLPRRVFLTSGPRGGLEAIRFVLSHRGISPYYEMHLHSQDLPALRCFTPEGWFKFYMRVAELLRRNPRMKGVVGSAWFFDPALASISPHLVYLRTMVTDNGGHLFCLGPSEEGGSRDATSTSNTRRRLYEKGEYEPMCYLVVWARDNIIAWADSASELDFDSAKPLEAPQRPRDGQTGDMR
jgi:hypothetical protein